MASGPRRGRSIVTSFVSASTTGPDQRLRCGFCGRSQDAVGHLVRGRGSLICDRCVRQAQEAITGAPPDRRILKVRPPRVDVGDRDAAEDAIEGAFETAFDAQLPVSERCRAIEGGEGLEPMMEELRTRYPPAEALDVSVDSIRFLGEAEAEVHFTLHLAPAGPSAFPQTGFAARVAGEWKVARETWCRLAGMVGVRCPPPTEGPDRDAGSGTGTD
jgi:hypothetical protein